ncbi:MAG: LON peptidase substrate-binding domain-containing protein, partial [Desulfocapsaceae bacterium]|nr:LON peptidase substrate-binding domain-containing protein [Desulfocapsaceae bacterium]
MAEKPTVLTADGLVEPDEEKNRKDRETSLVLAKDVLPETLLIIPLFDRPMFPKMMGPIIVEDPRIQKTILEAQQKGAPIYLGLLLVRPTDEGIASVPESMEDFFTVGVAAKVVQISTFTPGEPLQL